VVKHAVQLGGLTQIAGVEVPATHDQLVVRDEARGLLDGQASDLKPGQRQAVRARGTEAQQFQSGDRGRGDRTAEADDGHTETARGLGQRLLL